MQILLEKISSLFKEDFGQNFGENSLLIQISLLLQNPFLSTSQIHSPHLQSTTLEQGANQSRGAWIEAHNLGEELARG
ncbi:hypothetical protein LINPERPRIM_LOCUS27477, partial [Linum perenne]